MVRRKNRLTTDALREVRNTFSRFLSILVLSALAVAFLAGLRATAPDMEYTADNYYDRVHMMDGYVLSTPTVPEFLTGREFLKFFMEINETSIAHPKRIDEYFDEMSIEPEDRDKLLKDYSHGMKNKMQMLINIIAQPNILLLDEPLTSLDVVVAEEMKQLLRSIKQDRITIFSTHIMDLALDLCDEIVLLSHGELEVVEKSDLDSREFKEKIIAALREEGNE